MKRKEQLERLRELTVEELREEEDRLRESLFRLRFRKSLGVRESIGNIVREKKMLARVKTFIRQHEIKAEKEGVAQK